MTDQISISSYTILSAEHLAEIGKLAEVIRSGGIDPRISLEWLAAREGDRISDWLAHTGGKLVGVLSTSSFGGTTEATLAIAPDAPKDVATRLFAAFLEEAPRQGAARVLLLHDRQAAPLRQLAVDFGLSHDHAEQVMRRPADRAMVEIATGSLHVRLASEAELPLVAQVSAKDWGADKAEILANARSSLARGGVDYYIATLADIPVSALNIQWLEGRPWVYGFSVDAGYRGQGFGRQTLTFALAEALARSPGDAYLEVEPNNAPAVELYQSLGFAVLRTFDYWAKELVDGTHS